ncbi:Phosphate regulon transcriptional regulatory protein PhoB (SphR) [Pediococcus damnosus]|uniref:Phosphate regulon transcriptional regulatory protein PhoB (SphR) n=1 Tax=Pediococcus damnosus TaxID=51663 RepID=A0A143A8P8_9LACO|nr:response regulator transcription factor [Pediococcus damnosus]AMV60375.1 Phosphate regulon transcriptional regulatory protein PhoB (SphR) [Pediococcus damnosus]AMV63224.1 Phosphate regulon transcriptional regulatory protein PhoB (SphR) [Pediococcus damnosus]AMV64625.1 Phosphate regulon transcriptional regulatory protein PhoB (SphR) [Pediococcus damnosus]AMV66881.1 Phosphate regulon transcriptional regulatory protein PhoB (SphR) [Pediococcus damnosus]AMV69513.1 Phosphate regulon transcriptio
MGKTVLLVEDEVGLVDALTSEFQFEDYQVLTALDGVSAVETYLKNQNKIDLIVLDWMLPKLDGLGVLRRVRRESDVPIIMLTARDYTGDKVAGLMSGADDYITKPFDTEELLARMQVVLRRPRQIQTNNKTPIYQLDDLTLDTAKRQVTRGDHHIQLTQREYKLLLEMFKAIGKTFTRDELLDSVWGVDFDGQPNIVDVYIRYLRNKIDKFPDSKKLIHTIRGVGYTLTVND